jgi:putative addiction module antidote
MVQLTVRRIGNSVGVILPSEAVQALRISPGEKLFLTESPDGFRLTPYDPEFAKKMKVAERGFQRYRNALRELAK